MTGSVRIGLFGGLQAHDGGRGLDLGGPKQRAVLAVLALDPGRAASPSRLIDLVWGEHVPNRAEVSLQAYVSNLRRVLEPDRLPRQAPRLLLTHPAGYSLAVGREQVDVTRFEDLAARGHQQLVDGDPDEAAATLDAALAVFVGDLLPELAEEPWVVEAAARLHEVRATALEDRFDAGLTLGEHRAMAQRIDAAVTEDPYRERLRGQQALALYRSGRQRDALAALQAARRVLVEEIGIEPGVELRRLEAEILDQAPSLDFVPPQAGERRRQRDPAWSDPGRDRRAASADSPADQGRPPGRTGEDPAEAGRAFVGRDRELAALRRAFEAAATGSGRAVLVSGEPGIGKTRLVEEALAGLPEVAVAWGRCTEHAAHAAYWPCIQIGRQLEGAGVVAEELVSDLLPDEDVLDDQPGADRLWLHHAIGRTLASTTRPLVLVFDDLQWADPGTLRVLEFVVGDLRRMPVLLVATTRPVAPDAPDALVDCLGELARQPDALRLDLAGLGQAEVGRWIAERSRGAADASVAGLVHDRTGGNPFFVGEVVELLASEDRLVDPAAARRGPSVPAAVQDVIRRRVSRLPAPSQQLLAAASVIGRGFDLDLVAAVSDRSVAEVLDQLEPPLAAGLVEEGEAPGRFQFSHALVAEALAAESSPVRRARLHARVAEALASLRATDADDHAAEVAHHAFAGMAAGSAERAYEWSVRAARSATASLAHEDAAEHWGRAVRSVEVARPADGVARFEALLEQGLAHLRADAVEPAYVALVAAIDLAVALGDPGRVGRAAAAMHLEGLWFAGEVGLVAVDAVAALERALAVMPEEPSVDLALTLGALGENAYWRWPVERLDEVSARAVAVARRTGDPVALGRALHKRNQVLWRASTVAERQVAVDELLGLIDAGLTPPELSATGLIGAAGVAWETADVTTAEAHRARARLLARELGSPALITQLDFFEATLLTWHGRLDEAHEMIDTAYDLYRRTRRWSADVFRAGFKIMVSLEQDRAEDILELAPLLLDSPYRPWFQEAVAFALTELGRLDEARALVGTDLPPFVDCWLYVGVLTTAAHTRVALGDVEAATTLRRLLVPHLGLLGSVGTGIACGDVALALGRLDLFLGDHDAARAMADRSVATCDAGGAGPWLVRALLFRAGVTGDDADRERAAGIVDRLDLQLLRHRI